MYWFMKSNSYQTVPHSPSGNSDGVPTSKTPHPQAQAQAKRGARTTIAMAAANRNRRIEIFSGGVPAAKMM
jgi:hypothetical protein